MCQYWAVGPIQFTLCQYWAVGPIEFTCVCTEWGPNTVYMCQYYGVGPIEFTLLSTVDLSLDNFESSLDEWFMESKLNLQYFKVSFIGQNIDCSRIPIIIYLMQI